MAYPVSPLAPKDYPDLPEVAGVRFATAEAGIKYSGRTDVLLVAFDPGTTVAGVLTRSRCPSAAVDWCRAQLGGGAARALLVNSGNANAFTGQKGRVHLTFGQPLVTGLDTVEQVVSVLDRAILQNYVLHPSNCIAYQILEGTAPQVPVTDAGIAFSEYDCSEAREAFDARLQACDPQWRDLLLRIYANPVYAKLAVFQASC